MRSSLFVSVECAHNRMKVNKEVKREWLINIQKVETVINKLVQLTVSHTQNKTLVTVLFEQQ